MVRKPTFAFLRVVASNANPQPVDGVKRLVVAARRALMMPRNPEPVPKGWPPLEKEHEQH